jgi:hypothetical protein
MIVEYDFLDHWKTQMLIHLLDDPCAPQYVLRLWGHCQIRKTYRFSMGSKRVISNMISGVCKYPLGAKRTAEEFFDALNECGFIDVCEKQSGDENFSFEVHDWKDVNASLIASWKNGRQGGRPRKNNPSKTHGITQIKPIENPRDNPSKTHGQTDKIRVEEIRVEEKRIREGSASLPVCDSMAESVSEYLERFHAVHAECERVGEIQFVNALRVTGALEFPEAINEALDAFVRHCSGVFSFRPQTPLLKFENYLRHAMDEFMKKTGAVRDDLSPQDAEWLARRKGGSEKAVGI